MPTFRGLHHRMGAGRCALAFGLLAASAPALAQERSSSLERTVGPQRDGSIVVSSNQRLTPAGKVITLSTPPVRAKAVALNPNGRTRTAAVLLMSGLAPVIVFDTVSGQVLQRFVPTTKMSGEEFLSDPAGSFNGITYSAAGTRLFFSQEGAAPKTNGDNKIAIAKVDPETGLLTNDQTVVLPKPPQDGRPYFKPNAIIPGGIALSADSQRAYVALNAANTLGVLDLTGPQAKLIAQVPVGNAPNSVVVRGNYAYVSNEGGRPATGKDFTALSDGTPIVVDRKEAFSITGTVSVVDLTANRQVATIGVGLHPAGMAIEGSRLYVANAYSDSLSVVDLDTNRVVRTVDLSVPIAGGAFGSGPNGVALAGDGRAYVTLGQANAIAVVDLKEGAANPVAGYIPTAYFPTSITYDPTRKQFIVADDKGIGSRGAIKEGLGGLRQGLSSVKGLGTDRDEGTVNLIPLPSAEELVRYSRQVVENNHWNRTENTQVGPQYVDRNAKPVAVPKHIGEPSLIKHVFLIIKENKNYDQILGDLLWGNGDPSLAVFASATPNQHAIVKRFPLLDNIYAPSRQSADGHPWIAMSGSFYSNDILSPDWMRSYPGGVADDALTHTPRGFLWSAAQAKGLSVKLYGYWSDDNPVAKKPDGTRYSWSDFYSTSLCQEGKAPKSACVVPDDAIRLTSVVPSVAKVLDPGYPHFDMGIPDQYRANYWIDSFRRQDEANAVPNLTIIWLPADHTASMTENHPYPINYQADNDLALGRIVAAISHSKVWGKSAIFVEEDDAAGGVDHVDGHRMTAYVVSPYTAAPQAPDQGKAIHTTYTAENINRTIENILGTEPLTQFDLVASPMFDVFQDTPDLTPFDYLPATIPLDEGPGMKSRQLATQTPVQRAWLEASAKVMHGKYDKADAVDPEFVSRISWYTATDWQRPYPGEKAIPMPGPFLRAAMKYRDEDD